MSDPDGGVSGHKYQWQVSSDPTDESSWADIAEATRASFTPAQAQVGKYLRVIVSYTDAHGQTRRHDSGQHNEDTDDTGTIAALAAPVQGTALSVPVIEDADEAVQLTSWLWEVSSDPRLRSGLDDDEDGAEPTPSETDVGDIG